MNNIDKSFSRREIQALIDLKGANLISIDRMLLADAGYSWDTVRLHSDCGHLDINNFINNISLESNDITDEFAFLSIKSATSEALALEDMPSEKSTNSPINKKINAIYIVHNHVSTYRNNVLVTDLLYPQAICFEFTSDVLVLDKETWFSEMIAVKRGLSLKQLIYDESQDWQDDPIEDPDTHYEFSQEIVEL